jgi:hypothetical protein
MCMAGCSMNESDSAGAATRSAASLMLQAQAAHLLTGLCCPSCLLLAFDCCRTSDKGRVLASCSSVATATNSGRLGTWCVLASDSPAIWNSLWAQPCAAGRWCSNVSWHVHSRDSNKMHGCSVCGEMCCGCLCVQLASGCLLVGVCTGAAPDWAWQVLGALVV